jgi:anti-sigma factor RsiW
MTLHLDDRLDAWLDDELSLAERVAAERHLAECEDCREAALRLRALRDAAAALPREIAPRSDLWPGIASRLSEPAVVPFPARRVQVRPLTLAAAAAVIVALSSALTFVAVRRPAPATVSVPPEPPALVFAAVTGDAPTLDVEREYQRAASELVDALNVRRSTLSPETLDVVSRSLARIDEALAQIRSALDKDPGSGELLRLLTTTHKRRVEMLRRVTRLSRT